MEIKVSNLTYKSLFNKVNLKIKGGEINSIVGKNGIGKTMLFNLLFGSSLNFEGEILFGKKVLNSQIKKDKLKNIRSEIFYLTQDYSNQLFNVNIAEDMKFVIPNCNFEIVNELLDQFNLKDDILIKHFSDLSSSEIKKILLIMAFVSERKILFLDDPTLGLDSKAISTLVKMLKKEKRKNRIIILASQNSEFLLEISDRIIVLDNSKILEKDDKYEFFENKILINKVGLTIPKLFEFKELVLNKKKIKLMNRDNINDLIKDVYRNAR